MYNMNTHSNSLLTREDFNIIKNQMKDIETTKPGFLNRLTLTEMAIHSPLPPKPLPNNNTYIQVAGNPLRKRKRKSYRKNKSSKRHRATRKRK